MSYIIKFIDSTKLTLFKDEDYFKEVSTLEEALKLREDFLNSRGITYDIEIYKSAKIEINDGLRDSIIKDFERKQNKYTELVNKGMNSYTAYDLVFNKYL